MLMPVEDAAEALIKGLDSNRFEITFPWAFVCFAKLIGMLPDKIYLRLVGGIADKRDYR